FLLPGLLLGMLLGQHRRTRIALLASLAVTELGVLYLLLIRPNYAPELRAFWAADVDGRLTPALLTALLVCVACAVWLAWRARRDGFLWMCVIPCLLLAVSAAAGWYPVNPRTRLFALPCF